MSSHAPQNVANMSSSIQAVTLQRPVFTGDCRDFFLHMCPTWTSSGDCQAKLRFMLEFCPKSCEFCIPSFADIYLEDWKSLMVLVTLLAILLLGTTVLIIYSIKSSKCLFKKMVWKILDLGRSPRIIEKT
ncbi:uncharacterized protein LOC106175751 isoform X2 [Lingula anatina]|nr:uncharacterized protein LOC106175751 isoform X2 [Lingula anatina]|eukprot:XP_013413334.1 uncharacterized protein LOC106175751 isoform X2 [Lingula anatina]